MVGLPRKHMPLRSPHSVLVVGCALLWGVVEVLALSRARWIKRAGSPRP